MLNIFLPKDNRPAINAVAVAQHSDPMQNHARLLGSELEKEDLRRKYEDAVLVLAFSMCVNVGVIIWFLVQSVKALGHS
jgi:hypothetical protein